ncbi:MAG: hypothetical protein MZV70_05985 [Desulfobacterales bacterium]|nr:hypothetical protein [Desulfobacterales bacterium]
MLSTLDLHHGDRIAVQVMRSFHLDESGAVYEESEDLINVPLRSESVQVSVFFKENKAEFCGLFPALQGRGQRRAHRPELRGRRSQDRRGVQVLPSLEQARKSVLDKLMEALR